MKKFFVCLLTVLTVGLFAQEFQWQQNFDNALRLSKESGKPVFAFFTGSDWCGWCIRLDREILSKQEMKKYLNDNFILFKADFPQKNPPPADIMMKNRELMEKYSVRGYPTIIITDASGKALRRQYIGESPFNERVASSNFNQVRNFWLTFSGTIPSDKFKFPEGTVAFQVILHQFEDFIVDMNFKNIKVTEE